MAAYDEKTGPAAVETAPESKHIDGHDPNEAPLHVDRPSGWMYKSFNIFGKEFYYASPRIQLLMVSLVCFMCPGMFNALGGIGGGGQVDFHAQDIANTSLYSIFAFVGFFSGTVANKIGLRATLAIGGLGYAVYAASFLSYNINENFGFIIFAGCFLGFCAGLLWTAQGAIMMSYPPEESKGRYISVFWVIFNSGAVLGSLIPLVQNLENKGGPVNNGTYIGFIVLMTTGLIIGLFICDADKVIRPDGTKVILQKNPTWKTEFLGLLETLRTDWWIVALFPMFFSSNIFYTYQNNGLNASHFTIRTRSLNGLLYWIAQIGAAVIFGFALDLTRFRRTTRARGALAVLTILTFVIWGGGWAWQKNQVSRARTEEPDWESHKLDWSDPGFAGPMMLYFFYGFYDAAWQTCIYWFMGSLSNSGRKTANYAGFYKGIQSAGAAIWWRLDSWHLEFETMFGVTWGLLGLSLLCAAPVILLKIKDHVTIEEDLKFSNETIEDVIVGRDIKKGEEAA